MSTTLSWVIVVLILAGVIGVLFLVKYIKDKPYKIDTENYNATHNLLNKRQEEEMNKIESGVDRDTFVTQVLWQAPNHKNFQFVGRGLYSALRDSINKYGYNTDNNLLLYWLLNIKDFSVDDKEVTCISNLIDAKVIENFDDPLWFDKKLYLESYSSEWPDVLYFVAIALNSKRQKELKFSKKISKEDCLDSYGHLKSAQELHEIFDSISFDNSTPRAKEEAKLFEKIKNRQEERNKHTAEMAEYMEKKREQERQQSAAKAVYDVEINKLEEELRQENWREGGYSMSGKAQHLRTQINDLKRKRDGN